MIPKDPKIGDVFETNNTYYKVLSVNGDGTFVSEIQIGYIPTTVINDETVEEMKKVVEKKTTTKAPTKKPVSKKK